jgi:hypothetical protein
MVITMMQVYLTGDVDKSVYLDAKPAKGDIIVVKYDEYDAAESRRRDISVYHERTGDFEVTEVRLYDGGSINAVVRRA